jgi:hypothetical protein
VKNEYLIDTAWFKQGRVSQEIFDRWNRLFVTRRPTLREHHLKRYASDREYAEMRVVLQLLEAAVLADTFVVDKVGLESRMARIPDDVCNLVPIKFIVPPEDAYRKAHATAKELGIKLHRAMRDGKERLAPSLTVELPGFLKWLDEATRNLDHAYDVVEDKDYHDHMFSNGIPCFADSSDTLGRTLFYLELGRALDVVPCLSPAKSRWMNDLEKAGHAQAHALVVELLDVHLRKDYLGWLDRWDQASRPHVPPVAHLVARRAAGSGISLAAAASEIRSSPGAQEYRELLAKLQAQLQRRNLWESAGVIKALTLINKCAGQWLNEGDFGIGVKHQMRTLKLAGRIGPEFLHVSAETEITVRDLLASGLPPDQRFIAFVSSWVQQDP